MPFDLTAGIVRILLGPQKGTAGTGFVVNNEGLIVTCAHVVEDANAGPGDTVSLIFYAAKEKGEQEATVLPEYWCASNAEDVAFLRLKEKISGGVKPLPLGRYVDKNNFSTFGFPEEASRDGRRGAGFVLGPPHEMWGFARLQLRSEETTKGFSGAPVWDDELQTVIGMVIGIGKGRSIKWDKQQYYLPIDPYGRFQYEAFATPTDTIWKICSDLRPADQCPYRNLAIFTKNDSPYFFGRERVVDELVKSLQHEPRFLAVLGPSGCGKSSLVQAGLLPRLEKEAVIDSSQWEIIITRPTDPAFTSIMDSLQGKLQHIALIIDQFEELFTPEFSNEKCQEIVTFLVELLEKSPYVHLILTLRNDFYNHFVRFEELEQRFKKGMVNVPLRLQPEEVRDIIQRPANIARLGFDAGLVEIIIKDVLEMHPSSDSKESGALNTVLPLLEAALTQLWERRDRDQGKLTLAAYRTIGGVTGGLKQWADKVYYTDLTESERELADPIFKQLVYVNNDETLQIPYSRRQRRKDELIHAIASEQGMVEQVLQRLIRARLLVTNQIGERATIELSHEALIREWPKLRDLLDEARDGILFQQSLSKDVMEWEQRKQARDLLYRGVKLKQAKEWAGRNTPNKQEAAFIRASASRQTLSLMSIIVVVLLLISSAGVAVRFALTQSADPTVVTTELDSVSGSLRYCIDNAPPGSTIRFAQGMRGRIIKLTNSDLVFTSGKQLTIAGPGANQLTISGVGTIIHVSKGATLNISGLSFKNSQTVNDAFLFNEGTLTISSSIISGNKTTSTTTEGFGGGIDNRGTLTVTNNTIISNNSVSGTGVNEGGGIHNSGKLTLVNSIVSHNEATGSGGDSLGAGGGIFNDSTGTINVTSSVISDNKASSAPGPLLNAGGGIENAEGGTLTVTNSTFSGNLVTGNPVAKGGGISNNGKLTVTHSTFLNNTANSSGTSGFGGGIENEKKGTLTVTKSTFSGNLASGKQGGEGGGGIGNFGNLAVNGSTFSNNTVNGTNGSFNGGGGIENADGKLIVTLSTFLNNSVSGGSYGFGGGIQNFTTLIVINSTFSDNSAQGKLGGLGGGIVSGTKGSSAIIRFSTIYGNRSGTGGGIWVDPTGSSHMTISSSIIAANSAHDGPDLSGVLISGGYNLLEKVAGATGLNATTDKQVTLTELGIRPTLGNNGGPTQTLALLQGSKAIDAVPLQACSITITDISGHNVTITTDQRGDPRPDGSENACDVGAYESSY